MRALIGLTLTKNVWLNLRLLLLKTVCINLIADIAAGGFVQEGSTPLMQPALTLSVMLLQTSMLQPATLLCALP